MDSHVHIRYVPHAAIDMDKWDHCVARASNGLIYGHSYYLNYMASQWDGLVLNDYEAVMPLTWNRKYGIHYLYQPAFVPMLGIFGMEPDGALADAFISAIPKKFRLVEIALNPQNRLHQATGTVGMRNNYTLSLDRSYDELAGAYRENVRRNIKKAQQLQCSFKKGIPVEDVIALARPVMQRVTNATDADFRHFKDLFTHLSAGSRASTYGVYAANGELMASCVYFFSHKRACYILAGNHPNSKTMGASHYLIDRFIHEHAGSPLVLDFEGSDIRNLAFFYSSFGAAVEHYLFYRTNTLPFLFRWMK